MKRITRFDIFVFIFLLCGSILFGCKKSISLKDIPVVLGEQPANDTPAIVGSWKLEDFQITSEGSVTGVMDFQTDHPRLTREDFIDVLFIQVTSYYVWPDFGDWILKPAGNFIPIYATSSTENSATFIIDGIFEVPPLKIDIDGGMPLDYFNITFVWHRVGGFLTKAGWPTNNFDTPGQGTLMIDQQNPSFNGIIDTNVHVDLKYQDWIRENVHLGIWIW